MLHGGLIRGVACCSQLRSGVGRVVARLCTLFLQAGAVTPRAVAIDFDELDGLVKSVDTQHTQHWSKNLFFVSLKI